MRLQIRRVAGNMAVLVGGHLGARVLYLALAGLIARLLGADALGAFAVATVFGMLALFLLDAGLTPALIRAVAADPEASGREYADAVRAKRGLLLPALPLLALPLLLLPIEPATAQLAVLFVLAGGIESFAQLNTGVCRAHHRMTWEAWCAGLQAVVTFALATILLLAGQPLLMVGIAAIAGSLAELAVSAILRRRLAGHGDARRSPIDALRHALPYSVTSLTATAFFQLDVVILALVVSQAQVGEYAAVTRLLHGAMFAIGLASAAALPTVTGAAVAFARDARQNLATEVMRWLVPVAGVVVLTGMALAEPLIRLVYGAGFQHLAPLLGLGSLAVAFRVGAEALGTLLTAEGRQRDVARARLVATALTWLLLVPVVLRWGLMGGLAALVAGEAGAMVLLTGNARQQLELRRLAPVAGLTVVGTGAVLAVSRASGLPGLSWLSLVLSLVLLVYLAFRAGVLRLLRGAFPRLDRQVNTREG